MQYVRTGPSAKDLVFTDIGNFYIATEGVPFAAAGTQIVGELWVTYRIKLSRANITSGLLAADVAQDVINFNTSAATMMNGVTLAKSTNTIGVTLANIDAASMQVRFPVGLAEGRCFLVSVQTTNGAATTSEWVSITITTNATIFNPTVNLSGGFLEVASNDSGAASSRAHCQFWVKILNPLPGISQTTVSIAASGNFGANTTQQLYVTEVPAVLAQSLT
jgi:hypothetical protein